MHYNQEKARDDSRPKDPKPLLSAMRAGATYYYGDSLVIDFKTITAPDNMNDLHGVPDFVAQELLKENEARIKSRQQDYFGRTVDYLRENYGLPVSGVDLENLTITANGASRMALIHWFHENKISQGRKPETAIEQESDQPEIIRPKVSHHKTRRKEASALSGIKLNKEAPTGSGMTIPQFLKTLNTLRSESDAALQVATPLTAETARDTIFTLREQIAKLTSSGNNAADDSFANDTTERLNHATDATRYKVAQEIITQMLDSIEMPGKVSLTTIASTPGFNLHVAKPATETFGEWKKRTGALSDIVGTLLKDKQQGMTINNSGQLIVMKMDPKSSAYTLLQSIAQQQRSNAFSL